MSAAHVRRCICHTHRVYAIHSTFSCMRVRIIYIHVCIYYTYICIFLYVYIYELGSQEARHSVSRKETLVFSLEQLVYYILLFLLHSPRGHDVDYCFTAVGAMRVCRSNLLSRDHGGFRKFTNNERGKVSR